MRSSSEVWCPPPAGARAHLTALLSLAEGVHSPTARVACQDMPPIVRVSHDVADGLGSRDADARGADEAVEVGRDRHRRRRLHRHAGAPAGKRLHAEFFLEEIEAEHPIEGCNYLLALEMEMDPVPGYEIASWERGYGDFAIVPDLATLRRIPWLEATALVLGDVMWHDGSPGAAVAAPGAARADGAGRRARLHADGRLRARVLPPPETFSEAHAKGYRDLTPSVPYILDYHVLATTYDEPLLRAIRNGMHAAGIRVETSKGEAWPGQQEINFRFADALTMADNHVDLQERRQGDRVPPRLLADLHGEAVRGLDRQLVPHPLVALPRRRAGVRDRRHALRPLARGSDRVRAGARALLRADDQLVQALRGRELGADDARLGPRQPHLRVPRRRPREGAARRDADPGRRREPVPRASPR